MRYLLLLLMTIAAFAAAPKKPDSAIEADMRARLSRSKLGADGFQVKVQGGVATLTGRTSVVQHKGTATRMAKSAGAATVVNKIEITEEARKAAAERLADGRQTSRTERRSDHPAAAPRTKSGAPSKPVPAEIAAPASTPAPPPVRRAQIRH